MFDSLISFIKENIVLFDVLFLIFIIYFAFQCFAKGFFLSLVSFLKWVLALIITIILVPKFEPYISDYVNNQYVSGIVSSLIKTKTTDKTEYESELLPYLEFLGLIYLLFSLPLSSYYIFICFRLLKTKDKEAEINISKQIFAFSILYLFAIFISILVDKFA